MTRLSFPQATHNEVVGMLGPKSKHTTPFPNRRYIGSNSVVLNLFTPITTSKYHLYQISVSPSTTIMLKYRGRDSSEYHLRGAQVPPVVHVPQFGNHWCRPVVLNLFTPSTTSEYICLSKYHHNAGIKVLSPGD